MNPLGSGYRQWRGFRIGVIKFRVSQKVGNCCLDVRLLASLRLCSMELTGSATDGTVRPSGVCLPLNLLPSLASKWYHVLIMLFVFKVHKSNFKVSNVHLPNFEAVGVLLNGAPLQINSPWNVGRAMLLVFCRRLHNATRYTTKSVVPLILRLSILENCALLGYYAASSRN